MCSLGIVTVGALLSAAVAVTAVTPQADRQRSMVGMQENCRPIEQPKKMPAMSAMIDSAELMRRVALLDPAAISDVTVGVVLDETTEAFLVDLLAPTAVHDSLRAIVRATARARGKDFPHSYRVHITGSPALAVSIERSILCGPVSMGGPGGRGAVVGRVSVRTSPGSGPPAATNPRPFNTRQKVDSTGQVIEVDIGSGSGFAEVDRSVRETLRDQRFIPATLDGRPVSVWLTKGKAELIR
jgi:Gram-negative bacterial TonB protein C-terminal